MKRKIILPLLLVGMLAGCQSTSQTPLFDELGQIDGIKRIVEDFINEVLVDKRVEAQFNDTDLDNLHDRLVEQICELSGGPCKYTGKEMRALHSGMNIDEAQFNAVAEAIMAAMDNNKISVAAQNRLLALLVPMYKDIVSLEQNQK